MVVWIDGPCGVGKSSIAQILHKEYFQSNSIVIDSDKEMKCYRYQLCKAGMQEELLSGGAFPQNNQNFLRWYCSKIVESQKIWRYVIIPFFGADSVCEKNMRCIRPWRHILLTAPCQEVQSRIDNDDVREGQKNTLQIMRNSDLAICTLKKLYPEIIEISTEGKSRDEVALKIYNIIIE